MLELRPITLLLISESPLLLQAFSKLLQGLTRLARPVLLQSDKSFLTKLRMALVSDPPIHVVLVLLDITATELGRVHVLRSLGCTAPVLVLCPPHFQPPLEMLVEGDVQGIISSRASIHELEASIYSLADGRALPLSEQYQQLLQNLKPLDDRRGRYLLNSREQTILQLVAADLTDQQIADELQLSVRTVHNHLRHIYAKLGVRGRAGAVAIAILNGVIVSGDIRRAS